MTQAFSDRTQILLGHDTVTRLSALRVIVFGIGGVGSWCAEALARSGVGHLTLVDSDTVAPSNINRQLVALASTVGMPKVLVMKNRVADINPCAEVDMRNMRYTANTADEFDLAGYDYIVDAIDSLTDKALLIRQATASGATLISSMGAALKSDPTQVRVAEFWKVQGCPLARALRQRFRRSGQYPARKFRCVYSPQLLANREGTQGANAPNGSLVQATGVFGLTLASLIINDIAQL